MRKTLSLPLICLLCVGCTNQQEPPTVQYEETGKAGNFKILTIDSCQYIYEYTGGHGGATIAHKGNCKNPIHKK